MEQGLKEFIEETRRIIPSHFGRIITPLLSNVGNSEPNPLYYQENIFGFKKTLEERIVKTSKTSLILNNYVSSLTNLFQDIVLIFVHIHNDSVKDVDTSLYNYFNSLKELELYKHDVLNQQLIIDKDELIEAISFMITALNEMAIYFNRFSKVDLKSTPLNDSFSDTILYFEKSILNFRYPKSDLKRFLNIKLIKDTEYVIKSLTDEFSDYKGKKLIYVFNILLKNQVILFGENDGYKFYKAISKEFNKLGSYSNFMKNFPMDLNKEVNSLFDDASKKRMSSDIELITQKLKSLHIIS